MAFLTRKKFDFVSRGLAPDTFGVVSFKGSEGFSGCYRFEIDLVSTEAEVDLDQVLKNPATFTILREEGEIPFHGILAEFEQLHQVDEYVFYKAVLVPKLWWLSLTHHNQVFLDKTVPEIIEGVLKDGGLTTLDFDLRLQGNYPKWEYICQYRESHLEFVSRWMEREGMYYYFEQNEGQEKVIITDTKLAHSEMPHGKTMYYSPPSGLDEAHREEVIKSVVCRQKMLPKSLRLKDYNYRTPSLELSGSAQVKSDGRGEVYIYGEHCRTPEEGNALAKVRAEELLCQEKRFYGESTIPYLRPGYLFDLQDHYRSGFNQAYLTIDLTHEGSQAAFLLTGIQKGLAEAEEQPYYRNSFVAIPSSVQFRPERKTEKARFYGTMNAGIDASGEGKYAELDAQGRYKVVLPFDLSGRKDGKGSTWLRMAQPYAGADHGMHFPLHKGTEVLLTFIDGDPDRPIIQAAVPNPTSPSVVTNADQTMSKITTSGGSKVHFQDREGSQSILIHTPAANTRVLMGSSGEQASEGGDKGGGEGGGGGENEKGKWEFDKGVQKGEGKSDFFKDGFMVNTEGSLNGIINQDYEVHVGGNKTEVVVGGEEAITLGFANETVVGEALDIKAGLEQSVSLTLALDFKLASMSINAIGDLVLGAASTEIMGLKMEFHGETLSVAVDKTELQATKSEIQEVKDSITEMKSELDGEVNLLRGAVQKLEGECTEMAENIDILAVNIEAVEGTKDEMTGDINLMHGEKAEMAGSIDRMAGNITNLAGAKEDLAITIDEL